jgi:uncharacterized protein YeaO (DUF488 family)
VTGDHAISVARVYEQRSDGGEMRVLVDRIWPRELSYWTESGFTTATEQAA